MNLILVQPVLRAFDTAGNCKTIESLISGVSGKIQPEDILLLPEHFTFDDSEESYLSFLKTLAGLAGCTIVGGSHHRRVEGKRVNAGNVVNPGGSTIGAYTKLRPYFDEQNHVVPGERFGELKINGKNILIVICADFWYSDIVLGASVLPDLVLVPSLSVSRKPDASYSRSLWHHLAISRAYEFGVYVGISDWSGNSSLLKHRACGVGGFADPTSRDSRKFFISIAEGGVGIFSLDFHALEEFRADRRMRGFFWK